MRLSEITVPGPVVSPPRTGPGWQPLTALVAAAEAALDDMDEDEYERFERLAPWRKVAYRYLAADCDNFAVGLHRITGWPILGVSSNADGALHRLVRAPTGRLLDAGGWTDMARVARRHGIGDAKASAPGGLEQAHSHSIGDDGFGDELLAEVVSAIRQFPWAPYNTRGFQAMSFRPLDHVDVPRVAVA